MTKSDETAGSAESANTESGNTESGNTGSQASGSGPATVQLEQKSGPDLEVTLDVPAGWQRSDSYGPNTFEPVEQPDPRLYTSAVLRAIPRDQSAADARAQIRAAIERHRERVERPNINSGDPEKDAIRADVSVIEEEEFDGGVSHILRVEYSDEVLASGPYRPYVSVLCQYHSAGRDSIVELSGRMPLDAEASHLPAMKALCRSVRVADGS